MNRCQSRSIGWNSYKSSLKINSRSRMKLLNFKFRMYDKIFLKLKTSTYNKQRVVNKRLCLKSRSLKTNTKRHLQILRKSMKQGDLMKVKEFALYADLP